MHVLVYFRNNGRKYRKMTNTNFEKFVSSDGLDLVLKQIETNESKFKFVINGKDVSIRRARTRQATERNAALRGAAETLTTLAEMDTDVVIEWGREGNPRGVTVKGSCAFTKPSGGS